MAKLANLLLGATIAAIAAGASSGSMAQDGAGVQAPLACGRPTLGITARFGVKLCECIYDRGGLVTGMPAGYHWDCGILRPGFSQGAWPPATLNPYEGPYPLAVGIDRSDRSVIVDQTTNSANINAGENFDGGIDARTGSDVILSTPGAALSTPKPPPRADAVGARKPAVGPPLPLQPPD